MSPVFPDAGKLASLLPTFPSEPSLPQMHCYFKTLYSPHRYHMSVEPANLLFINFSSSSADTPVRPGLHVSPNAAWFLVGRWRAINQRHLPGFNLRIVCYI